jgi:hypothetical protein
MDLHQDFNSTSVSRGDKWYVLPTGLIVGDRDCSTEGMSILLDCSGCQLYKAQDRTALGRLAFKCHRGLFVPDPPTAERVLFFILWLRPKTAGTPRSVTVGGVNRSKKLSLHRFQLRVPASTKEAFQRPFEKQSMLHIALVLNISGSMAFASPRLT